MNTISLHTPILSVSALTRLIKQRLEDELPDVWVEGEISNLRVPNSGHIYYTLKDEAAQLRASLSFFTAVVRTQASQYEPPKDAISASRAVTPTTEPLNNDQGLLENGGPG